MSYVRPDTDTLRAALTLAVRAPSVHNTQPWLWRIGDSTIQLYADESRRLPYADPDSRELVVSCGAALHHLRVALRALGWETLVRRFPNPAEPRHLASIEVWPTTPDPHDIRMARAITARRSDRRRFTSWEVPAGQVAKVMAAGKAPGIAIHHIDATGERTRLLRMFTRAALEHAQDPGYAAELRAWSGQHALSYGVPARNAVVAADPTVRGFTDPLLPEAVLRDTEESSRMLVLCSGSNDLPAWLRVGEAASAVLLTATVHGLATCPLTEPLELPQLRERIRADILGGFGYPQLMIRMGWAASSAAAIPPSPRLALDEVVRPLEPAEITA
ncbi:NAD(P)H nitroreductase [Nocardia sp. NBC_01503]|uniref:Acg family FMN-binding oxidoreductase n=1 Tax=Nocardia sp. NBC_01503 TaxID=2975997 RepID=UPI002E7AE3B3|nr:NAD(P)H nitroreductase [Nocardia sp. NBC_01503]WTL30643.1 NAD(P)H nitroreductase [Nocardia sp. NBC_01503]